MPAIMMNSLSKARGYNQPSQLSRRRKGQKNASTKRRPSSYRSVSPYASDLHLIASAGAMSETSSSTFSSSSSLYAPIAFESGFMSSISISSRTSTSGSVVSDLENDDVWGQYVNVDEA